MANLDLAFLAYDPDFSEPVTLIRRLHSVNVNAYGEGSMTEISTQIVAVVDAVSNEIMEKFPEMAVLSGSIEVFYAGSLYAQSPQGYSDIIVWNSNRYEVTKIIESDATTGQGFTRALCVLEAVNNA